MNFSEALNLRDALNQHDEVITDVIASLQDALSALGRCSDRYREVDADEMADRADLLASDLSSLLSLMASRSTNYAVGRKRVFELIRIKDDLDE